MIRKLTLSLILSAVSALAAISSSTVWEVRAAGAATNGGGYSSGGTDLSAFTNKNASGCTSCQSATVNISTTDAVTNNSTTVTSATGNFSSALIGNTIYLAGSGTTTGWYQVASVPDSGTIILDRATGSTGGTGVTMNIAGALTLQAVAGAYVAGNSIYIQSGTYAILSAAPIALATAGTISANVLFEGYASSHGDMGTPPVITSSVTSQSLITMNVANYHKFRNINFTHTGATRGAAIQAVTASGVGLTITQCSFSGVFIAFDGSNRAYTNLVFARNVTLNTTSTSGAVINSDSSLAIYAYNTCFGAAGPCYSTNGGTSVLLAIGNLLAKSGTVLTGMIHDSSTTRSQFWMLFNNTIANGVGDGVQAAANGTSGTMMLSAQNNIFYGNAGKGINFTSDTGAASRGKINAYNAYGSNTGGNYTNWANGVGVVTLSANPFNDDAGTHTDYSLNTATGGGASLRAAGFPGSWTGITGLGSLDIGAIQSPNTGGQRSYMFIQ